MYHWFDILNDISKAVDGNDWFLYRVVVLEGEEREGRIGGTLGLNLRVLRLTIAVMCAMAFVRT